MTKIFLSIPKDITIQVQSSEDLSYKHSFSESYIPGIVLLPEAPKEINLRVRHIYSIIPSLEVSNSDIIIKENWKTEFPLDFYHFLYSISRTHFLRQNLYSIHSACVGSSLFVGHSGSGKTTIMQKLNTEYNLQIHSTNKSLLKIEEGVLNLISGTKTVTHSEVTNPNSKEKFADRIISGSISKASFPKQIASVFLVKLNDGVAEVSRLSPLSSLHQLFPFYLDTVYADTVLANGSLVYHEELEQATLTKLSSSLHELLCNIPVFRVSGSLDFVTKTINQFHEDSLRY